MDRQRTQTPPSDRGRLEALALSIAQRGWCTPAIVILEMLKPLGFVGSQLLLLGEPLLGPGTRVASRRYATLLEDRDNVEQLLALLESHRTPSA